MKDYYKILGIDKSASQEEIKKSYRKLAKKYHPDLNSEDGSEERFKEIQEAYEILSDPQKRRKHDNPIPFSPWHWVGEDPFRGQNPFENIFSHLKNNPNVAHDQAYVYQSYRTEISVDWLDMIFGVTSKLRLKNDVELDITIPQYAQNGQTMYIKKNNIDYYITLRAQLPRSLTPAQLKKLKTLKNEKN